MSIPTPPDSSSSPGPNRSIGLSALAWVIVVMISGLLVLMNLSVRPDDPSQTVLSQDVMFELQARYTLGASRAMQTSASSLTEQLIRQASNTGQRTAAGVVKSVVLDQPMPVSDLSEEWSRQYPWSALLADPVTRPRAIEQADRAFRRIVLVAGTGLAIGALGLVLGLGGIIGIMTGGLRLVGVRPQGQVGVYIEAFAVWLVVYLFGSVLVHSLEGSDGSLGIRMLPLGVAFVVGLFWPGVRGTGWARMSQDIGLHRGRGVLREVIAGLTGYLACLPLVALTLVLVLFLQRLTHQDASHPIQQMLGEVHPVWIYLLAAVFAPLTEEVMFRGFLFTHLRAKLGVLSSGLINGLIFAAIHPQGWIAIPTLCTIALILSWIREWRGSLIGPMVAHAFNNAVVVTILLWVTAI